METNDTPAPVATGGDHRAAFEAKVAELAAVDGEGGGDSEASTPFAESLTSEGIDVQVTPKEGAPDSGTAPATPAPEPTAEDAMATESLLDSLAGYPKPAQEEKAAIEREALALGLSAKMAKQLGYRTSPKEAREFLAETRDMRQTSGAGQAVTAAEGSAASQAPAASSPDIQAALTGGGLEEDTASAIAGEFQAMRAELAELRQQASVATESVSLAARAQAQSDLTAAMGELRERFPQLVSDSVVDAQVGQTARALMGTDAFKGNLKGALEAAAQLRWPAHASTGSEQTTNPTRETLPPATPGNGSAAPLTHRDRAEALLATARRHKNDPGAMSAELRKQAQRIDAHNATAGRR